VSFVRSLALLLTLAGGLAACSAPAPEAPDREGIGVPPLTPVTLEIVRGLPLRERFRMGASGLAYGPMRGPLARALYADRREAAELDRLAATYARFTASYPERRLRLRFLGRGQAAAPAVERRRISEWALGIAAEAAGLAGA